LKEIEKTILREVVYRYIKSEQPIGSSQLRSAITADLSSATIRNYFRRLVEEGYLTQIHSSSGRIPTNAALKSYWREALSYDESCEIELRKIADVARNFGLYALLHIRSQNRLVDLSRTKRGTLIAEFERGAAAIKYSNVIERLLTEFFGYDISDLLSIARSNRIDALYHALWQIERSQVERFNKETLIELSAKADIDFDRLYDGQIIAEMSSGIYFGNDAMFLAQRTSVDSQNAILLACGTICRDYLGFISNIRKEDA
jgi:heat-inducible transcriptional repressor